MAENTRRCGIRRGSRWQHRICRCERRRRKGNTHKSETAGATPVNVELVVFDRKGRELSRQELCGSFDSVPPVGAACPITGANEIVSPRMSLDRTDTGRGRRSVHLPTGEGNLCLPIANASLYLGIAVQSNEKGLR